MVAGHVQTTGGSRQRCSAEPERRDLIVRTARPVETRAAASTTTPMMATPVLPSGLAAEAFPAALALPPVG